MDYAMYTDEGNHAVRNLVIDAIKNKHSWTEVIRRLADLARDERFEGALDTMVRECVFDALVDNNVIDKDNPFHI